MCDKITSYLPVIYLACVGTYCQQREVEAITENVDDDEGMYV